LVAEEKHGMVDPSATDGLKGLVVDMSQIDAAQLGTDRPSGLKSQRHCLVLIAYVQIFPDEGFLKGV
jgi:hypothetical protein